MPHSPLRIEVDTMDRTSWDTLITQFDDASIYQTWEYGVSAKRALSHIIIKEDAIIVGCCQIELRNTPLYKIGIADIHWGPLCLKKGGIFRSDVFAKIMRGIKEEYAINRGYFLRIWPHAKGEKKQKAKEILESEGFEKNPLPRPYRTFLIDLSPNKEDLRKNFLQKWRNCLNKAEKNELSVVEGTSEELYDTFLMLLTQMVDRKKFDTFIDYQAYGRIQKDLPDSLKMKIMICKAGSEPVCALISTAIGDTGIYLLGATGEKGLNLNGSYLLQWRMMQWLKEKGIRYYDLGAFNPELNPGVYHFKQGLAGKAGWEEVFIGEYHGCFSLSGRLTKGLLNCAKYLRTLKNKDND